MNLYGFVGNSSPYKLDILGLEAFWTEHLRTYPESPSIQPCEIGKRRNCEVVELLFMSQTTIEGLEYFEGERKLVDALSDASTWKSIGTADFYGVATMTLPGQILDGWGEALLQQAMQIDRQAKRPTFAFARIEYEQCECAWFGFSTKWRKREIGVGPITQLINNVPQTFDGRPNAEVRTQIREALVKRFCAEDN